MKSLVLRAFISLFGLALGFAAAPSMGQESAMMKDGERVYDHWCAPCHDPGVEQHPGTMALEALYEGEKPAALEDRSDLTPETVRQFVRQGVSIMPFFRKTEISEEDMKALSAYLSKTGR